MVGNKIYHTYNTVRHNIIKKIDES